MIEKQPLPKRISISQVGRGNVLEYDIVLVGEEHLKRTHYEAERRLLKNLGNIKPIILATEYFYPEHQLSLDASCRERVLDNALVNALNGYITDDDISPLELEETRREAFLLYTQAVRLCDRVIGINHDNFAKKDKFMADMIDMHSDPRKVTLTFVGKLHTENGRLPYHLRNKNANFTTLQL